jgi:sporulation protein YlmC with PRC-barrel domain
MADEQGKAQWTAAEWQGKMLVDINGEKIGKLQDVYVDVETDVPQFATVKEGFIGRHLTFVPLGGIQIGPDDLQVQVTKEQVQSAPDIDIHGGELSQADESTLYHHFELNYTPIDTPKADAVSLDASRDRGRARRRAAPYGARSLWPPDRCRPSW